MDERQARLRLWQDTSLVDDVDLDAVAARHAGDDEVLTLVDLARSVRCVTPVLAGHQRPRTYPVRRALRA